MPMPRFAPKSLFSLLFMGKAASGGPAWDRIAIIVSTAVTIGLAALYAYGKMTSRW